MAENGLCTKAKWIKQQEYRIKSAEGGENILLYSHRLLFPYKMRKNKRAALAAL